jgi:uncharacterized OB-fold protein
MSGGIIYTETLVHSAPEQFINEAPYQLVIVTLDGEAGRVTGRLASKDRVSIGDRVAYVEHRNGTPYFQKS